MLNVVMLSVVMLNVLGALQSAFMLIFMVLGVMLNAFMMNMIMLGVTILSAVRLRVMAPLGVHSQTSYEHLTFVCTIGEPYTIVVVMFQVRLSQLRHPSL